MSKLARALNRTYTTNRMTAHVSTLDPHVDLFFKWGASRGQFKSLVPIITRCVVDDADKLLRLLLWGRDIRGGAGERQLFIDALKLVTNDLDNDTICRVLSRIPELGRWDDLLNFKNISYHIDEHIVSLIHEALLTDKDGLCAKWMPRKGADAAWLRNKLELSPKEYRKLLVSLTNVVETKMCDNKWTEINYSQVPSLASARYQKAFGRHDNIGYGEYIKSLQKGETKINAAAVYPYDIVKSLYYGNDEVAVEQWKALPDYLNGDTSNTLVVADVSGSMKCPAGGNTKITCLDVCISLAIYLSERNHGIFKDQFITFSRKPELQTLKGSLSQKVRQLRVAHWQMNTDLEAVFRTILNAAILNKLSEEDMPKNILILSDMQFDKAVGNENYGNRFNPKAMDMIRGMYEAIGYKIPNVIFWNLNSYDNVPVEFNETGVALVSGFSPSIMKNILSNNTKEISPYNIMMTTIDNPRYNY